MYIHNYPMRSCKYIPIIFLLTSLCITCLSNICQSATYTSDNFQTSNGNSYWQEPLLTLQVSISNTTATYKIAKIDNGPFSSSGMMYLKAGSPESYGSDHGFKSLSAGDSTISFTENLDNYPSTTYPKQLYARYESSEGGWAWVGPITITRNLFASSETDYQADSTESTDSYSSWGLDTLRLQVSVSGSNATFLATQTDNTPFGADGTMYLKLDSAVSSATTLDSQDITESYHSSAILKYNLDNQSAASYPHKFYVHFSNSVGDWGWVGPISISKTSTPPPATATGSIFKPTSPAEGNLTVSCSAYDPDGLQKVSVVFSAYGTPLVLCEDGTSNPCSGTSDSWTKFNVDPQKYGINGAGSITLGLWVRDDNQNTERLADKTISWAPAVVANTPPTGEIELPTGLVRGTVTIRASASDVDGLSKVSAVFAPNGTPLALCDDNGSNPCSGTSGSWEVAGVNPFDYDASAGGVHLGLHVQDDAGGNVETLAASSSFTWIVEDSAFPKYNKYFNVCVGHNYEQQMPVDGVEYPSVTLEAQATARSGEHVIVQANGTVDTQNGGAAFYYYCTKQGQLLYDDAHPETVTWVAPIAPSSSEEVKIFTQIGDGLGYVASDIKTVTVTEGLADTLLVSSGVIYPGETIEKTLFLDNYINRLVAVVVEWPGSDLDLSLVRPDGVTIDYTSEKVFGYYEGDTREYYVFYNDTPGTWQVNITAVEVDSTGEPYEFKVMVDDESLAAVDSDGDGISDSWEYENFGDLSHSSATDADNDGLNDLLEYQNGTDPHNPDSDNDGMPDGWEVNNGLNPLVNEANGDLDGDGFTNLEEYLAGTEPNNPNSYYTVDCDINVPGDFSTLQDAINHVSTTGGVICVDPGTYVEGKLELSGNVYLLANSDDPADTIIDGNGTKDVIIMKDVQNGGVIGFTITNSRTRGNAAGISCKGGAQSPIIAKNIISGNLHGIRVQGNVSPLIINNTIARNSGDGILVGGSLPATLVNNIVAFNSGAGIKKNGKAIGKTAYNDAYGNDGEDYKKITPYNTNISVDPMFTNGYYLASGSPCIDAGLNLDGTSTDMGAYGNKKFQILGYFNDYDDSMADTDNDGIDDTWELSFFGNLTTASATSDLDNDGYTDVQEYLNYVNGVLDPNGNAFDPKQVNTPGGPGYEHETDSVQPMFIILDLLLDDKEE